MAKELFSIAAQEHKESAREVKQRRIAVSGALIFSVLAFVYAFDSLRDLPLNIRIAEAIDFRANQIILMKVVLGILGGITALVFAAMLVAKPSWLLIVFLLLAVIDMGMVVLSDLLGFDIVRGRGLAGAYFGCIVLPILKIVLVINQNRKRI